MRVRVWHESRLNRGRHGGCLRRARRGRPENDEVKRLRDALPAKSSRRSTTTVLHSDTACLSYTMVVVRLHYAKSDAGTVVCVMSLYDDIRDVPLAPLTYDRTLSWRPALLRRLLSRQRYAWRRWRLIHLQLLARLWSAPTLWRWAMTITSGWC